MEPVLEILGQYYKMDFLKNGFKRKKLNSGGKWRKNRNEKNGNLRIPRAKFKNRRNPRAKFSNPRKPSAIYLFFRLFFFSQWRFYPSVNLNFDKCYINEVVQSYVKEFIKKGRITCPWNAMTRFHGNAWFPGFLYLSFLLMIPSEFTLEELLDPRWYSWFISIRESYSTIGTSDLRANFNNSSESFSLPRHTLSHNEFKIIRAFGYIWNIRYNWTFLSIMLNTFELC